MRKRILALGAALVVGGALAAGLAFRVPAARAAITHEVTIVDFAFDPASLTIQVGDTVRWHNSGSMEHTVTSASAPTSFSSPALTTGQEIEFTFTAVGVYAYHCSFHPSMTGEFSVQEEAPSLAPPSAVLAASPLIAGERSAEESALPDGALADRTGADPGDLRWGLLVVVVLGGMVIARVRRT